ncbi:MAG: hypothetical protein ACR5LA_07770 [Wolbachia sp.]
MINPQLGLYNIFDQKLDPSVSYSDDTIYCKLTFTLWSCRYPEHIRMKVFLYLSEHQRGLIGVIRFLSRLAAVPSVKIR